MTEPALQPAPPAATLPRDPAVAGAELSDAPADPAEQRPAVVIAGFADRLDEGGGVITALRFVEGAEDVIHGLLIAGGFFVVHWRAPIAGDPVIERHVHAAWRAFLTGCLAALGLNFLMGLPPLTLSPMVGVMGGMTMTVNAHLLSGWFYLGAVGCFAAAAVMPFVGRYDFLVLGGVFCLSLLVSAARHFRAR
jgi:hypothetical protein